MVSLNTLAPTLYATLAAQRDARVVPVVVAGHSVTAQITANRWTHKFNQRLQDAYPREATGEQAIKTLAQVVATPLSGTGVVVVNAAISGSTSASYLSSTTRTQIMALKPAVVIHSDLPANDYGSLVAVATVKSNLIASFTDLISKENASFPTHHVLVGGYYPTITSPADTIANYRTMMGEVAATFPGKVTFIDTYDDWTALRVGSGGNDPLDLLGTDNLHPNDAGHRVLADAVSRVFDLPDGRSTDPGEIIPEEPTLTTITSDTFTGSGTINGRSTDIVNGGSAKTWTVSGGGWTATSGVMRPSSASFSAATIDAGLNDGVQVSAKLHEATTAAPFYIELFRSGGSNAFLFGIGSAGTLNVGQSSTGTIQSFTDTAASLVGKRLALRYLDGKLSAYVDGVKYGEWTVTASGGTLAGFSRSTAPSTTTLGWDDFLVESVS